LEQLRADTLCPQAIKRTNQEVLKKLVNNQQVILVDEHDNAWGSWIKWKPIEKV
jgi:hypothetical protein